MYVVSYLRARLQADTPVYSILNCDARIYTQSICAFAKFTPVNLQKHKISGEKKSVVN